MDNIKVTRKTTESEMTVELDFSPVKPDYRDMISTSLPFLDHMIEHIVWRSGVNIKTEVKLAKFTLTHLICEDLGIALGKAFAEYVRRNTEKGMHGYGDATGIIDEAKAQSAISFESRAYFHIDYHGAQLCEKVEGTDTEDLETFLEGFVQGAQCTLHVDLFRGSNGHHIWEAIFRSFGAALGNAIAPDPSRAGMTSGVAGKIEWTVE
ncbi:MAG: hypothetical protein J1F64_02085 [Oscillospiraceae bacterium]|nr:hypothetical protein [Oscillospiraceae bacterium]